jgi:hypothetical protein
MGCDGGSIPRRDELVKLKKKEEKPDPNEVERIKWSSCAISKEPLKEPIVACELGFLYNKETVIRHLLDKTMDESFKHIRNLKDLIPVRFTVNPAFDPKEEDKPVSPFICPVTLAEVGRHQRFSLLKSCGCVLSERALREVPSHTCLQCGKQFETNDIMPLNPTTEEMGELRQAMETRRASEKQDRKEKKERKKDKKASEKGAADVDKLEPPVKSNKSKILAERENGKKRTSEPTAAQLMAEPPTKALKSATYASIFTSSIKHDPNARVQETFMCRNVLRG